MKIISILTLSIFFCNSAFSQKMPEPQAAAYSFRLKVQEKEPGEGPENSKLTLNIFQLYSSANVILGSSSTTFQKNLNGLDTAITMPSAACYLRIDYAKGRKKGVFLLPVREYQLESGNLLEIDLYADTLIFKGRDSLKFNLQTQLFALNRRRGIQNGTENKDYFALLDQQLEFNMANQLKLLNSKKSAISPDFYTYLFNQIRGMRNYYLLGSVVTAIKLKQAAGDLGLAYYLRKEKNLPLDYDDRAHQSSYLMDYLQMSERLRFEMEDKQTGINKTGATRLLDKIASKYSGNIRDRLLVTGVISLSKLYLDADSYFETRRNIIPESSPYFSISNAIRKSFSSNTPAFEFALPDSTDKIIKLADFRGKTLVVDYWFTGCGGCILLNKAMKPVFEHFKNRSEVVFLSISIDQNKPGWLRSVRSGAYTHPGTINLRADGFKDPMILHYNITSYPKLMLIDAQGKLISKNLIYPNNAEAMGLLIKKIEETTAK